MPEIINITDAIQSIFDYGCHFFAIKPELTSEAD